MIVGESRRAFLPRLDADTYAQSFLYAISLNEPWSTVQNLARSPGPCFWESWSQSRPGSSSDLSSTRCHPSQPSTPPSGSPSSPSSPLCIWSPRWVPDSSRLISRGEICSRSIPPRCTSLAERSAVRDPYQLSFKSGESGSRVRFSILTVLDSLYPLCLFQRLCRSVQQPAEIRTRSRHR